MSSPPSSLSFSPGRRTGSRPDQLVPTLAETGLDDATRERVPTIRYVLAGLSIVLLAFIPLGIVVLPDSNLGLLQTAFHTGQISWIQTVPAIAGMMLSLPLGRLGDLYGKRRIIGIQGAVTVIGCVICALAHSFALFLVGRGLQGFGMAVMVSVYGLVRDIFPRRWIPRAIALTGVGYAIWNPLANLMGTWATEGHSASAMFWLLGISTAVAVGFAVLACPETPLRTRKQFDLHGMGLFAVGLFAVTYGLSETSVSERGWSSPWTIGFLAVGLVLLAVWYFYERLSEFAGTGGELLRDPRIIRPLLAMLAAGMLFLITEAALTEIAETPSHLGPLNVGYGLGLTQRQLTDDTLFLAPFLVVTALLTAWYARRRGPRLPTALGILVAGAGLVVFVFASTNLVMFLLGFALYQAGAGAFLTGLPILIIEAVPAHDQGVGGGLLIVMLNGGSTVSTQLIGAVNAHHVFFTSPSGQSIPSAGGLRLSLWIGAAIALVGTGLALRIPHGRVGASGGALPDAVSTT